MQTLNEKLATAKAAFDAQHTANGGAGDAYKRHALPEVLAYLKAYVATGKYPYNKQVEDYIILQQYNLGKPDEQVLPALYDYLGTEVYLAQHDRDAELEAARDTEMLAEGFQKLSPTLTYRGPAFIRGSKQTDWMASRVNMEGKIIDGGSGYPFFIPKGRRTRGYSLFDLKGYYQPIAA